MPAGPAGVIASAPRFSGSNVYGGVNGYTTSYKREGATAYSNAYTSHYNHDHTRAGLSGSYYSRKLAHDAEGTSGVTGRTSSVTATRTRRAMTPSSTMRDTREAPSNTWDMAKAQPANAYGASNQWLPRAATPNRLRNAHISTTKSYGWSQRMQRTSRVTLILDLDETLVHSSFEPTEADLHIPVVMEGEQYMAYVKKRPYMEEFLARCVELFDVVVWTASLAVYAEPLINELCRMSRIPPLKKMYREACTQLQGGGYVKDLTTLGRSLDDVCILDNSPSVAQLQPKNLIPIVSWYEDQNDTCLRDLLPHLERLATARNVQDTIPSLPGVSLARQW